MHRPRALGLATVRLELTGFAPDSDPATQGILTDCNNIVPSTLGLAAGASRTNAGLPALAAACSGAFVAKLLDGTKRTFAATSAGIYEAATSSWTDRSRVGGYTGSNRWSFTMFGSAAIATNKTQLIQVSLAASAFSDIATSPKAAVVFTVAGFVMALNYDNGTDTPDGWFCSGIYNHTIWTPAVATQCANGRLLEGVGRLTAGAALGSNAVAYKATSMYYGTYVGGSVIWSWQRIPGDVGAVCNDAVVVVQTRHFFVGDSDIYVFDGTVPRSIGAPLREWFFRNLNATYKDKIIGVSDLSKDLIYWYYPSTDSSSGAIDSCIVYNYRTERWGKFLSNIQMALDYTSGQITYDGLGALYATYDALPTTISYDSSYWLADTTVPAVFDTSNILQSLTGAPGASYLVTGDFGDETEFSFLKRVTPRYRTSPSVAIAINYHKSSLGDMVTQDTNIAQSRNRFDFRRDARWHRIRLDFTGPVAINGLDVDLHGSSRE